MSSCTRCNKRAAKRYCPALGHKICPVCCAEDRMIELACPESCQHLRAARESEGHREREFRARELPFYGKMSPLLREKLVPALVSVDLAIVRAFREHREAGHLVIRDADVADALDNTIKNLETEDGGIIYEHRALSALVQDLGRRIRAALEELNERAEGEYLSRGDMIKALGLTRDTVRAHLLRSGGAPDSRTYIRHVSLYSPWVNKEESNLII